MKPNLSIRKLQHRRGTGSFLLEVDELHFMPGRIYCLTGPNGSGKSTLLHLLALLSPPDRGEIRLGGEETKTAAQRQRLRQRITLVEQSPLLFNMSVYRNLAFGLRLREVRGDLQRRRIGRALQAVGLPGFEPRPARSLSGGEAQRVALARALVLRPTILLLDEPTDGLDRKALCLFERCLTDLAGGGSTVILATHDPEQPRRLGAETLALEGGQLRHSIPPDLNLIDSTRESA